MIAFFVENKVAANLLMLLIVCLGWFFSTEIRREAIPSSELDVIFIQTIYPSASPEAIETKILKPIEQVLAGVSGLRNIRSYAQNHKASISVEVMRSKNTDKIEREISQALDTLQDWPDGVDQPTVRIVALRRDLLSYLVISGRMSQQDLKALAQRIKSEMTYLPSISEVEIGNIPKNEVRLEVIEDHLKRYQISFEEIFVAIKKHLSFGVGGEVRLKTGPSTITTQAREKNTYVDARHLEQIVVRTTPDGGVLRVIDVASVVDGFEAQHYSGTYNGEPAVYLSLFRQGTENIVESAEQIKAYVAQLNQELPDGINAMIWQDTSRYYVSRIKLLQDNGFIGLLILFGILAVFLNLRLAFWISLGIPVAFLGAFIVMPVMDVSINMISTFGFLLVLGIVVDDAIIVGENIHRWQERIPQSLRQQQNTMTISALRGAQQISRPVLLAVLTSIIMFAPLLFLPGTEGKLIRSIPIVVIAILFFSLVESFLILPAHLSMWLKAENKLHRLLSVLNVSLKRIPIHDSFKILHKIRLNNRFKRVTQGSRLKKWVKDWISWCLKWRYATLMVFFGLFSSCVALLTGQWLSINLLSPIEADSMAAELHFPVGTPSHVVNDSVRALELSAEQLNVQFTKELALDASPFLNTVALYGQTVRKKGTHLGAVIIELSPTEDRPLTTQQIVSEWRRAIPDRLKNTDLRFETTLNKPGPPIRLGLFSSDDRALKSASDYLYQQLVGFPGVHDIRSDFAKGAKDIVVTPLEATYSYGISLEDLTRQIQRMFHGVEIAKLERDDARIPLRMQLPRNEQTLWKLETLSIKLPNGSQVPLNTLASIELTDGAAAIKRIDGERSVTIVAEVDSSQADAARIMSTLERSIRPKLEADFPTVKWKRGTGNNLRAEVMQSLLKYSLLALFVMYVLMSVLFRSYIQPFLVLFAVPFGLVGAMMGHWFMGLDLTLWSMVGMTAVSGIVVNDNLVLLDFINTQYKTTRNLYHSILHSVMARLRPILLTTATTFSGLVPILFETSIQAQFLIPMAVSMAFGVIFSTFVTLVLVPVLVMIFEDLRQLKLV